MEGYRRRTVIVTIAIVASLAGPSAQAQRTLCNGMEFFRDSTGHMVSLDLARSEAGAWSLTHARLDRTGSNRAKSVVQQDNDLQVVLDGIAAEFRGTINQRGTAIVGEWIGKGARVPFELQCTRILPNPRDAAPHRTLLVTVAPDVALEVLDWGGSGRPLILIHGMNQTAHDFDDFAPKLTSNYRVYAVTRRGAGRSSAPDTGYAADRLGDDILAIMDSLRIVRPVLVGHSYGGAELSSIGSRHPERVAGLVYLDAAMGYAYLDMSLADPFGLDGPNGIRCPCTYLERLNMGMQAYRRILAPALAFYAVERDWATPDRSGWSMARQAESFERNVPGSRVVRLQNANHYVHRSNEAEVLREMHAFIRALP